MNVLLEKRKASATVKKAFAIARLKFTVFDYDGRTMNPLFYRSFTQSRNKERNRKASRRKG